MPDHEPEAGLEGLLEQLRENPEDFAAHLRAGQELGQAGRFAEALSHLREAVRLDPEHPSGWYALGVVAVKAGEPDTARHALEELGRTAAPDARGLAMRANLLRQKGAPDAARELAGRALEAAEGMKLRAWIHGVIAGCCAALGDVAGRLRHTRAAAEADPESIGAVAALAELLASSREYEAARPWMDRWTQLAPDSADAWYGLGVTARRQQDHMPARAALERAAELGYEPYICRGELGALLAEQGEYRQAAAELDRALAAIRGGAHRVHLLNERAYVAFRMKQYDRMRACYEEALELDPANAYAHQGMGASHVQQQDAGAALAEFEEAVRLAPEDAHAWYALGSLLAWNGPPDRAAAALERAVALGHEGGEALARLACVYQQQGRNREAAETARRALRRRLPKSWRVWVAEIENECRRQRR